MRLEHNGKSTGVGAYEDCQCFDREGNQILPDYTNESKTGNHWTKVWKDLPEDVIVVNFGRSRGGTPFVYVSQKGKESFNHEDICQLGFGEYLP